jgi:hypothetical protein
MRCNSRALPGDCGSHPALAIKPVPDIVDGILVEAGIEIVRDVADMRRGQEVRQTAERIIGRQRLAAGR